MRCAGIQQAVKLEETQSGNIPARNGVLVKDEKAKYEKVKYEK
jgi:hypothetical protein